MSAPSFENYPSSSAELAEVTSEETRRDLGSHSLHLATDHIADNHEQDAAKQAAKEKVARRISSPWITSHNRHHGTLPNISPETVANRFMHHKISVDTAAALIEQAEVMRPVARVAIRQPLENFAIIVKEGQLKSVLETGTSNGIDSTRVNVSKYQDFRRKFEATQFDQTDSEPSVIYGFLDYSNEGRGDVINMPVYGSVQFTLKPDVAARTTFSEDDSLQQYGTSTDKEQFMGFDDAVIMQQVIEHAKQSGTSSLDYVESQIHGGVDLNDVESVELTLDPDDLQGYIEHIELLHAAHPDIAITINLDYSKKARLPSEIISTHPDINFHPIVKATHTVFDRERMAKNEMVQSDHQKRIDRVSKLRKTGDDAWKKRTGEAAPSNFKSPKLMHLMNGDRLIK